LRFIARFLRDFFNGLVEPREALSVVRAPCITKRFPGSAGPEAVGTMSLGEGSLCSEIHPASRRGNMLFSKAESGV
jgi:hypothetical protein